MCGRARNSWKSACYGLARATGAQVAPAQFCRARPRYISLWLIFAAHHWGAGRAVWLGNLAKNIDQINGGGLLAPVLETYHHDFYMYNNKVILGMARQADFT